MQLTLTSTPLYYYATNTDTTLHNDCVAIIIILPTWLVQCFIWFGSEYSEADGMNAIKTQMTPEEQLEDLQRRFQLLEGERKATYETAQLNIRQNKEIIKQMKEESK